MIRTELALRLPNNAGALAGVYRLLGDEQVRVLAMGLGDGGQLRLVVDNPARGLAALSARHHQVTTRDVLVVEGPGLTALQLVADADLNVEYAYGAAPLLVLGVDDALRVSASAGV